MTWSTDLLHEARVGAYACGTGTHLPLLASVIAIARPGPVLEIGTGHGSAPLVAEMCAAMGRRWIVVDHEQHWLNAVEDLKPGESWCSRDPSHLELLRHCAVAFVDTSPPLDRLAVVKALRGGPEFIVIHDADNQGGDLAELLEHLETFPHRFMYTRMRPWTVVVSDTRAYPGGGQ